MSVALRPTRLTPALWRFAGTAPCRRQRQYSAPSPSKPAWVQRVQQLKERPAGSSNAAMIDELVEEMKRRQAEIHQLTPLKAPETTLVPEAADASAVDEEQFNKDAYKQALLEEARNPDRHEAKEPSLWRNALEWLAIAVLFKVLWDFSFSDVNRAYVERKELQRVQEELRLARHGAPT
eukprot:EG_transcript_27545